MNTLKVEKLSKKVITIKISINQRSSNMFDFIVFEGKVWKYLDCIVTLAKNETIEHYEFFYQLVGKVGLIFKNE